MARHQFTQDERSRGGKRGYETVRERYEWGRKFLKKRMFRQYHEVKQAGNKTPRQQWWEDGEF